LIQASVNVLGLDYLLEETSRRRLMHDVLELVSDTLAIQESDGLLALGTALFSVENDFAHLSNPPSANDKCLV
jgi:hypothetical protein